MRRHGVELTKGAVVVVLAAVVLGIGVWSTIAIRRHLARPLVLDAPPPAVVADLVDVVYEIPPSTLGALVTYHLGAAVDSLEAAVPLAFGDIEERHPIAGRTRASFGYTAKREPFRIRVDSTTVTLGTEIEYQGRVWYRPPLSPELSVGCGVGDAPRPRLRAALVSTFHLTPQWELRTETHVVGVVPFSDAPRDRCRMSVLRLDVTDRVMEAAQRSLEGRVVKFDDAVTRWPVRRKFVRLWSLLQRPIRLTDGVYLQIDPYSAQLGAITAEGDTIRAPLRILASPRIVTGVQHNAIRPLPPLGTSRGPASEARVVIEGSFTYPAATALLRRSLVGRGVVQQGRRLRIKDLELTGIGGGRVALGVTVAGSVRGRLYFTGTPSLDSVTRQISVPDLDYDVGTARLLVEGFAFLRGMDIRDFLRERARLPDSSSVGRLRRLAETGIHRRLASGVRLSGTIHDARGVAVRASTKELRMIAVADAEFRIDIDRGPKIPRLQKTPLAAGPVAPTSSADD